MSKLVSHSLESFLQELGSAEPVPGGGSAAALVLAQAAALGEMTARLNSKRAIKQRLKKDPSRKNIGPLSVIRKKLLSLLQEDAGIFLILSKFKKEDRVKPVYQKALVKAAAVPYRMCVLAGQGIELAASEKTRTSAWLYSDLLESAVLFEAGFRAARLNVEINLNSMKNKKTIQKTRADLDKIAKKIERINHELRRKK